MEGFNTHRHKGNPKEKELHDSFLNDYIEGGRFSKNMADLIVFGSSNSIFPNDYLTEREKKIALSIIQWLGSPVGEGFLAKNGFELKRK